MVKVVDAPARHDGADRLPRPITPAMVELIRRLVATHPAGQVTAASAAGALRLDPTTAYHHLHHLTTRGWLEPTESGMWIITPQARILEHLPSILDAAPEMLDLMGETHERARVCLLSLSISGDNHPSG